MYYNSPYDFSFESIHAQTLTTATRQTKEFYLKAGGASSLPYCIRYLNFYLLLNDKAVYLPATERITRSTSLNYYFSNLTSRTRPESDEDSYSYPLLYTALQRDVFKIKDICAIHLIEVSGQVQTTFETSIPEWARNTGAVEQLGVSLAFKLSPKHRVRVYTRNNHIIVFTTKGLGNELYETDYKLLRKLWACIPLLCEWDAEEDAELINLCKALDKDDATFYWTLLEQCFSNNQVIKDLKYSNIIQTFNSIAFTRRTAIEREISDHNVNAERLLKGYAEALERKRIAERSLLELLQINTELNTDTIKMLVDKKICYNLDIVNLGTADARIAYRCSAPLLSYDKDAARIVYNKRVKGNYSDKFETIYKLLFVDEKAVLMFDQAVDISLAHGSFTARTGNTRIRIDLNASFPNPHHYHFSCWGNYGPIITKLIHEYKLEEMFYQIKAATGALNFTDYPVISRFLEMLETITEGYYNPPCFYWKDEACTTPHTLADTINHFREETE